MMDAEKKKKKERRKKERKKERIKERRQLLKKESLYDDISAKESICMISGTRLQL